MKRMLVVAIAVIALMFAVPVMAGNANDTGNAVNNGNGWANSGVMNGSAHHNNYGGTHMGNNSGNTDNSKTGIIGNTLTDNSKTGQFGNDSFNTDNSKTGIFGNKVKDSFNDNSTNIKVKDSLNQNQLGLINQKGTDNQQGLLNVKGKKNSVNTGVVGTGIIGNKNHHNVIGGDGGEGGGGDAQQQGQKQAIVGSGNSASMGNKTSVDIKYEADKRELLGTTAAPSVDAKLKDTKASKVRARGSLLDRVEFLTMSMAKRASKNASDMNVEPSLLFENNFELDRIKVGEGTQFGGYIYVFADGSDCYLAAMDAEAAEVAMKAGMTHIIRLGEVEVNKVLAGSSWNIGFSGGASLMTSGEDIGIAPNGGLGYGKAKSSSQFRPDAVYVVSYSAGLVRVK